MSPAVPAYGVEGTVGAAPEPVGSQAVAALLLTEGLHGEVIPLAARIMAVADVIDALTSPRVYKPAFPLEKALQILEECSGTQFDPKCVNAFMDALPEVKQVLRKYQNM
jgi:response regulator RpfG family c-di-GMP phosphodiesterase